MATNAMLIDLPRCTGCRGCQVACKQWNKRPAEKTEFFGGPGYQNPADLSKDTWCLVTYNEVKRNGRFEWVFGKKQCMHCEVPGCISACPVGALEKLESGPVIYHKNKCIGCRYCMLACPFLVPRFEYSSWNPYITKCTFCADRQEAGEIPACAKACPTGAIVFGERDELIREAQRRISQNPSLYVHHIYGLHEAGGTCLLHISSVPFEKVGYITDVPTTPMVKNTETAMKAIPAVMLGLAFLLGASYRLRNRPGLQEDAAAAQGEK
ncbi:MAG: 4Fe-4S dicluster domain-containing protein [Planctomycetes bacterium]|nr:4Fe-4S dicluster domain-containing protein [Planctomycetota bacterium]